MLYVFFIEKEISDLDLKLFFENNFLIENNQIAIRETFDFPDGFDSKKIEIFKDLASGDFKQYLKITTSTISIEEDKLAQKISKYFKCKTLFSDDLLSGYTWYM